MDSKIKFERQVMSEKYFNFSDVLGFGWRIMRANLRYFS